MDSEQRSAIIERQMRNEARRRREYAQAEAARREAATHRARTINQANRSAAHKLIRKHFARKFSPLAKAPTQNGGQSHE
jgi:hypothetical protein